jgi:Xaa-Pro aminopeptidase
MLTPTGARGRVARLRGALDARLQGAVIARPEHLLYFANLFPLPTSLNLGSSSFLLLRSDGTTTLFTDNWLGPSSEATADEIIVVEWYSMKEPARNRHHAVASAVASQLRAEGLKVLGGETSYLPALVARVVDELVDIDGVISSLREIKDPDELEAIRLAIRTAEAAHAASREFLEPGIREIDYYAALLERSVQCAERPFVMMCDLVSGDRASSGGGPPTSRRMQKGELVILDFFPYVDGYRGDIANTLCVGAEPSSLQAQIFERVKAALEAGEALLRPGAGAAEVFAAMESVLANGRRTMAGHGGHAIGLGHPEPPHIVERSDRKLTAGMVITLEPGLYDPSFGGIRLEHNYLITQEGFERLSGHQLGLV